MNEVFGVLHRILTQPTYYPPLLLTGGVILFTIMYMRTSSHRKRAPPDLRGRLTPLVTIPAQLHTAAQRCDSATLSRLALNTTAACDSLAVAVNSAVDAVSGTLRAAEVKVAKMATSRDKRLEWQWEELDANVKLLECMERHLWVQSERGHEAVDVEAVEECFVGVAQLLDEWNPLPTHYLVISASEVASSALPSVVGMSHVQRGVDAARSVVSPTWGLARVRGEANSGNIACRDEFGDVVRTVREEDVHVGFHDGGIGWAVGVVRIEGGDVAFTVTPPTEGAPTATLYVNICDTRIDIPLKVLSYFERSSTCCYVPSGP